jgi:uncharacterized RDD family membrane protein YckC
VSTLSPAAPERPAFALPAASWGSRAGALLLDVLAQLLLALVVAGIVYAIKGDAVTVDVTTDDNGVQSRDETELWALWGIIAFFISVVVYPWLALGLLRGATPGRRLVGIRVVDYDGTPIGVGRAFLREGVTKGILGVLGLPLLASYLWPLWDPHQRALHDLIVSTRVVRAAGPGEGLNAFGGQHLAAASGGEARSSMGAREGAGGGFSGAPPPPPPPPPPPSRLQPTDREKLADDLGLDG